MLSKKLLSIMLAIFTAGTIAACGPSTSSLDPSHDEPTSEPDPTTSEESIDTPSESDPTAPSVSEDPTVDTYYTVTFYDDGRVYGSPVQVKEGETVEAPIAPTREGTVFENYVFSGWFEAGSEAPFDFSTPITKNLDLYSEFESRVIEDYDLIVYVYGVNTNGTEYIKKAESDAMYDKIAEAAGSSNILWHYIEGVSNKNFNKAVNESPIPVDLVISGNKLDNDDIVVSTHDTYGKTGVGEGWFENTSRYVTITSTVDANHLDLAVSVYNTVKNIGPDFKIRFDAASLSLQIGDTKELGVTFYGDSATVESSDNAVATIDSSYVITAVGEGTATITGTDAKGNTATCEVVVTAAPIVPDHDLVIILNNSNASNNWMDVEDAHALVEAFKREGQAGYGKDIELNVVSGVNIAGVVSEINNINQNDLGRVDAALCRSAFFTNKSCPEMLADEPIVDVDASWGYSGGQFGIFANAFESHIELAREFAKFVAGKHIDAFDMETSVSIKVGETYQLTVVEGATYSVESNDVITVSSTGLITAVAAGVATVKVTKGAYTAEVSVTVSPLEVKAVVLNIYIHNKASKYYINDDQVEAIKSTVTDGVADNVTVNFTIVEGKNADVTSAINEAEEVVHFAICAKAAVEGTTVGYYEGYTPVKVNADFVASGESRYMGPLGGITTDEYLACMSIVDLLS